MDNRLAAIYAIKDGESIALEDLNKEFSDLQFKFAQQFNHEVVDHAAMEIDFTALRERYVLLGMSINGTNVGLAEIRKKLRVEKLKQPYSETRMRESWAKKDRDMLKEIQQMVGFIDAVVQICQSSLSGE